MVSDLVKVDFLTKKIYRIGSFIVLTACIIFPQYSVDAQTAYGAAASYSLHKAYTNYSGPAIQIRRTCDNAALTIGFTSCGDLDTVILKRFVLASNPLSAIASPSAAAFSLRKLSCSYTGKAIQVRRSSDNTTQDIGFTSLGDLDTAALKTFVGTGSGFVRTWYDQSGNGRNATQTTNGNQPRIVNAGVIERQNGIPAVYFGGLTFRLSTANFNTYGTASCFNGVAKVNTNVTYNAIVNKTGVGGANNYPGPLDFYNNNFLIGNGLSGQFTSFTMSQTFNAASGYSIWTYQANGTAVNGVNAYYNSTQVVTNQKANYYGDNNTPLHLGSRADGATGLNGWISEVITFSTIPAAADRQFLEWSQGEYYYINGPTYVSPASPASAYVTTWYDQSGNGYHASQATDARQPQIINLGIIHRQSGKPAIYLNGTTNYLSQTTLPVSNPYSLNAFATRTANGGSSGYQRLIHISALTDQYGFMGTLGGNFATFTGVGSSWNDILANSPNTAVTLNSPFIMSMTAVSGAGGLNSYLNGTGMTAKNGTTASATGLQIGAPYNGTTMDQLWTGTISELNVFSSALSQTRRTLLETTQASYYGTSISNSKYTGVTGYNYYVNGIGYTSATDYVASTSQSVGLGFVSGTTASDYLQNNGDYITAGTTCLTNALSTANLPSPVTSRWQNDWYIYKTDMSNNGGTLQIHFDYADYGIGGTPSPSLYYGLLRRTAASGNYSLVPSTYILSGSKVIFTVKASDISNGYYTLGSSSSPLPVELLSFKATASNNEVDLKWVTVSEINNKYFTIERSIDGVYFESFLEVAGSGNSMVTQNYSAKDAHPYRGVSYYRLKQTDYNGKYCYSSIQSVTFNGSVEQSIYLYPSPLLKNQPLTLQFEGYKNENVLITMKNLNGEEFFNKNIHIIGNEGYTFNLTETLPAGVYVLVATSENAVRSQKVVVQ